MKTKITDIDTDIIQYLPLMLDIQFVSFIDSCQSSLHIKMWMENLKRNGKIESTSACSSTSRKHVGLFN